MARAIERLTAGKVRLTTKPGMYPDGLGLFLRIGPTGAKSWIYRYADGKTASGHQRNREMGLGPVHTIGLAEARERARLQRQLRLDGADPIDTRKAARLPRAMTFRDCAVAFMASMEKGWSAKSRSQWKSTLETYAFPVIGELPTGTVDKPAVLRVIAPLWNEKTETARRLRGRIESIIGWAVQHGHRAEGANPAAWKGALEFAGLPHRDKIAKTEHYAAMPYAEVPAFLAALRARKFRTKGIPARALEFAILTATRAGEVTGATWLEIDLEAQLWTIPAERMKMGREHRVPLSEAAVAILQALPRKGLKVFLGCSPNAMPYVLATMPESQGVTQHGFRSSFRDWCAEQGVAREVAEAALAHSKGSAIVSAYERTDFLDRRRGVMQAWAEYCGGEDPAENVVRLAGRAS
jgi:integrase